MYFTNDEVKCDAISATWNPALLIVDMVQFTGQSEIVSTISNSSKTFFGCLQRYPIDTYGAAWLDEFASGQLRRVSGRLALNNLLGALTDPSRLGLGFCGLIDHAAAKENALICAAPIKPSLCSLGESDPIGSLLNLGLATLQFEEKGLPSGAWLFKATVNYPQTYFGKGIEGLLNPEASGGGPGASLCSNKDRGLALNLARGG